MFSFPFLPHLVFENIIKESLEGGILVELRQQADKIMAAALKAAMPDIAVKKTLSEMSRETGKLILIAPGKAGWQMAKAAYDVLGDRIHEGVVITKYGHSQGAIGNLRIFEAGHPVPDENSFLATEAAMEAVRDLRPEDRVLLLLSGGGSALFEKPLIPPEDLERVTRELLQSGAEIREINTIRKRFSAVKGGRFAELCAPAQIETIVLSDVLGDRLDLIASGPACEDRTTCQEALEIAAKYQLSCTEEMKALLRKETPKSLPQVKNHIVGSVRQLCLAAETVCRDLGYETMILTDRLSCTARDAGILLGNLAAYHSTQHRKLAFLLGGETVVKVTGSGMGGRNQELALAAAEGLRGLHACLFSLGSDGTDGPTDAAGGYVDGKTADVLESLQISIPQVLQNNDAYHALKACGGLIITGPTGTNVNDLTVLLMEDA